MDLDVIESELGSGDAHTCLALNRAYQEILQENIKRIELVLTKNRERQVTEGCLVANWANTKSCKNLKND